MSSKVKRSNRRPGANETAKIKEFFNAADLNKDGVLCFEELSTMLEKMDIKMEPDQLKAFFDEIDVDKSSKIEFGEFLDYYTTFVDLAEEVAQKTMETLVNTTTFSKAEIEAMYENYKRVSSSVVNDGAIDIDEFKQMMVSGGVPSWNSFLLDGLFRMFDRDSSGTITFAEFVTNLSLYHNKSRNSSDEKHKFLFSIYDVDQDGKISKSDLAKILSDCLCCNNMVLSDDDVMRLVEGTFARNGCGDAMDLQAYLKEVRTQNLQ